MFDKKKKKECPSNLHKNNLTPSFSRILLVASLIGNLRDKLICCLVLIVSNGWPTNRPRIPEKSKFFF